MKCIDQLKPTTIDGIKRLAKRVKKADGIAHHEALDKAAVQAGFQNFRHAQRTLSERALEDRNAR